MHNAFGSLEYAGGAAGMALLARGFAANDPWLPLARPSRLAAGIVLTCFAGMLLPALAPARGLLQRGAELCLFAWVVAVSLRLLATEDRIPSAP